MDTAPPKKNFNEDYQLLRSAYCITNICGSWGNLKPFHVYCCLLLSVRFALCLFFLQTTFESNERSHFWSHKTWN